MPRDPRFARCARPTYPSAPASAPYWRRRPPTWRRSTARTACVNTVRAVPHRGTAHASIRQGCRRSRSPLPCNTGRSPRPVRRCGPAGRRHARSESPRRSCLPPCRRWAWEPASTQGLEGRALIAGAGLRSQRQRSNTLREGGDLRSLDRSSSEQGHRGQCSGGEAPRSVGDHDALVLALRPPNRSNVLAHHSGGPTVILNVPALIAHEIVRTWLPTRTILRA